MPIPLIVSALAAAVPLVVKGITGISQQQKAKKLAAGLVRPKYEVPKTITEAVEQARQLAMERMLPGQSRTEERISAATAGGVEAAKEAGAGSAGVLSAASRLGKGEQISQLELGRQAAEANLQNKARLSSILMGAAPAEEKAFEYNTIAPYQERAAAISALKGSGMQNVQGAVEGIGQIGTSALLSELGGKIGGDGWSGKGVGTADATSTAADTFVQSNDFSSLSQAQQKAYSTLKQLYPNKTHEELMASISTSE